MKTYDDNIFVYTLYTCFLVENFRKKPHLKLWVTISKPEKTKETLDVIQDI